MFIWNKNIFQYFEGTEDFTKQQREEICDQKIKYDEEVFYFLVFLFCVCVFSAFGFMVQ